MKNIPSVTWGPIDASDSSPVRKKAESLVVRWEAIDPVRGESFASFPAKLKEKIVSFPEGFKRSAEIAWNMICRLDQNPTDAVREKEIALFQEHLQKSGVIGGVYVRAQHKTFFPEVALPEACLPPWLQRGTPRRDPDASGIEALFQDLTKDLPYRDGPHGRYFEVSVGRKECPAPRQYKIYIEGDDVRKALRNGRLKDVFQEVSAGTSSIECKLFEGSRVVIYGKEDISFADDIIGMLEKQGIAYRGPAQDVWTMNSNAGALTADVSYSNDQALGDGGRLPNALEYPLTPYSREAFMDWYIRLCAFTGKSPSDPYKTSFVYLLANDLSVITPNDVTQVERLCGYPVFPSIRKRMII